MQNLESLLEQIFIKFVWQVVTREKAKAVVFE